MNNPSGMFDNVSPKLTFWFGVLAAIAILSTFGFFLLLSQVLEGSASTVKGATTKNTNTTATAPTPSPSAAPSAAQPTAPAEVIPTGTIALDSLRNVRGSGDLTVIEYSDTECPFCKRFFSTMQQVIQQYDGKVRWAYKHSPIESLHAKAPREAQAFECAAEQKKFWEYHDELFTRTPSNDGLEDSELFTIADAVGLDRKKFDACLEAGGAKDIIAADSAEGQKYGLQGTPFSLVIDKTGKIVNVINGAQSVATVKSILDQALAQ